MFVSESGSIRTSDVTIYVSGFVKCGAQKTRRLCLVYR